VNIRLEKHSELEATVVVDLVKEDYQEKVDSQIKKIQKTANINGFRPGKAPLGMIKKLYGKSVIAEEIQQMASDKLNNYIKEESLDILGYPIGSEKIESSLDIENSEEFTFAFDIGLAPSFDLNIKEKDKLEQFKIEVSDKEVDEDIDNARKRHAKLEEAEKSDAEAIVYAEVTELGEDGNPLEGGVGTKPVSFVPSMIEDKKLQKAFVGIGKDFETSCDVRKLFNNNEAVITNSLGVPKEAVADLSDKFSVKVTEIKSRILPELNEEYYQKLSKDKKSRKTKQNTEAVFKKIW
jgi:trigger factor